MEEIKWMYKSVCSENDGLVTYIEPWKEEKCAEQYMERECETVTIVSFNE